MNEAQWLYLLTLAWQQKHFLENKSQTIPALICRGYYSTKLIWYILDEEDKLALYRLCSYQQPNIW